MSAWENTATTLDLYDASSDQTRLMVRSGVFRDMLAGPEFTQQDKPIDIDARGKVCKMFLDLLKPDSLAQDEVPLGCDWQTINSLITLGQQYDAPCVIRRVRVILSTEGTSLPAWEFFKLAARLDDRELAKMAVNNFHGFQGLDSINYGHGTMPLIAQPAAINTIDIRYVLALHVAIASVWEQRSIDGIANPVRSPARPGKPRPLTGSEVARHFHVTRE